MTLAEKKLIDAIDRNFTSPAVSDSNFEPANIVDSTSRIADAIYFLSRTLLVCFLPSHLEFTDEGKNKTYERLNVRVK